MSEASAHRPIPVLAGLGEVIDRYDGFVLDLWGVLHDGVTAYPGAVDGLRRLRAAGKRTLVLSNAPRRAAEVIARCAEIGVTRDLYDELWTSGESAWIALRDRVDDWHRGLGGCGFHLGPARDKGILEGLDYDFVDEPAAIGRADFILNTGTHGGDDIAENDRRILEAGASRRLPMICANPDLVVIRDGRQEICAGTLARFYQELGAKVRYHGKPHRPTYDTCLELLGVADRTRIVAVGDALATDIAGARVCGIDGILVCGGIHGAEIGHAPDAPPDPVALAEFCATRGEWPVAAMGAFRW